MAIVTHESSGKYSNKGNVRILNAETLLPRFFFHSVFIKWKCGFGIQKRFEESLLVNLTSP